jgi:hypothetical protein
LYRIRGCSQAFGQIGGRHVNFRATSYITYLSFHQGGKVDALECFDGLSSLANILLKAQGGTLTRPTANIKNPGR